MNPRLPVVVASAVLAELAFAAAFALLGNLAAVGITLLFALVVIAFALVDLTMELQQQLEILQAK